MDQNNESSSAQNSSTEASATAMLPPSSYSFVKRKLNEQITTEAIFDMDLNKLEEEEEEDEEEELTDLNCILLHDILSLFFHLKKKNC